MLQSEDVAGKRVTFITRTKTSLQRHHTPLLSLLRAEESTGKASEDLADGDAASSRGTSGAVNASYTVATSLSF